jgi:uncharacterized sulfatase
MDPKNVGTANRASHFATIDLAPTLLTIAGVSAPPDIVFDGVSMHETLLGRSEVSRDRPLFFRRPPDRASFSGDDNLPDLAVRDGRWKLLCTYAGSSPQLYDLEADPTESNDLAATHPEIVTRLREAYDAWFTDVERDWHIANEKEKASEEGRPRSKQQAERS